MTMPGLAMSGSERESFLRTYGSVGTIFSIVSLYAQATARPKWQLFRSLTQDTNRYTTRDEGSDQRKQVFDHAALNLLYKPNPFWSRMRLMELSQMYLDLTGESYWVIERAPGLNLPIGLWPVRPDRIDPVPDPETYLAGYVYTSPDGRERIPLQTDEVISVLYPNPMDQYHGLGPVQSVLIDIQAAQYSAEWNRNYFINSAEPGGIIEVDHELQPDEWEDLMNHWRQGHRGVARAHRVAVLEAGQKWVPNQHTAKDMDFGNLRNIGRDIFREVFRMHKVMLGVSDDVNRANAQTGEEVFASWGITPRLDRWSDALNFSYLSRFGSTANGVELDYITPIPANREQDNMELATKAAALLQIVQAGAGFEDACRAVGLPPMRSVAPPAPGAKAAPPKLTPGESGGSDAEDIAARFQDYLRRLGAPIDHRSLTGAR